MGGGGCGGGMVTRETRETDDVKLGEFGHKVVSPCNSHFWRHQIYLYVCMYTQRGNRREKVLFVASLNRDKKLEQKTKLRNIMVSKSDESASNCYGHGLGLCPSHIILRQTYVVVCS